MDEKAIQGMNRTKKKILLFAGIIAAFILIVVVAIFLENRKGKLKIVNHSSYNLEYINTKFVYDLLDSEETEKVDFGAIASKSSEKFEYEKIDLSGLNANLEIRFKLEGMEELFVDAGIFNDMLKGNVNITFEDDGENVALSVKVTNQGFGSSFIDCDEEYTIYTSEGYID